MFVICYNKGGDRLNGFDPISQDDPIIDEEYPSSLEHLVIDSNGSGMLGVMFKAQGVGPHPTALILHGFPGYERNFDIAHALHRAGWNSVVFHYRGAWGSKGEFSFGNMIEDIHSCLTFIRSSEWVDIVDGDRITIIGHSMGGWAGFVAASEDPRILNVAFLAGFDLGGMGKFVTESEMRRRLILASFRNLVAPLGDVDPEYLLGEVIEYRNDWDLISLVEKLKGTRILMVGASRDPTSVPEMHHVPIAEKLRTLDPENLTVEMLDSDHNFSDRRVSLTRVVLEWVRNEI